MRKANYPTQAELRELFEYKNGHLMNRERNDGSTSSKRFNKIHAGKSAGCTKKDGYHHITINRRQFVRSNLVWIYFNGNIPEGATIDHINRRRTCDKIENLRLAFKDVQEWNKNPIKKKSNLPQGVSKTTNKEGKVYYQAKIRQSGVRTYLGTFKDIESARMAYEKARKERDEQINLR